MSATCQRPTTTRLISRSGASGTRGGALGMRSSPRMPRPSPHASLGELGFDRVDVVGAHFADCRHLAVDDLPQPEWPRDVAILVERNRTDDAFVADRLTRLQEIERLGEIGLARV